MTITLKFTCASCKAAGAVLFRKKVAVCFCPACGQLQGQTLSCIRCGLVAPADEISGAAQHCRICIDELFADSVDGIDC